MSALARLTARERQQYEAAGDCDRQWFRRHRGRRYRLRPASPAEIKVLGPGLPRMSHVLVHRFHEHARLRHPVHWSIPGDLPDSDAVLARLHAGAVFGAKGGHA